MMVTSDSTSRSPRSTLTTPPGRFASARRTVLVAGALAALGVGVLVVVPGSPDGLSSAEAASPTAATPVSRSSSALARSLAAQARTLTPAAAKVPATVVAPSVVALPATGAYPVLEPGARVPAVKTLQGLLKIKQTGWYGPMTLAAVVAFQKSRGLPSAGYVGLRTWTALLTGAKPAAAAPSAPAKKKKAATRATSASRSSARATVTAGRVCPAPGASFGQGWGAARGGHSHQGMDLSGRRGLPILAIESGVIIREGRQGNGALRIVMQGSSGSKFYYGHMSRDVVHAGSRVSRGQVIGYMGDSGSPGSVHLHFEYWRSGGESAAVNPESLLRAVC